MSTFDAFWAFAEKAKPAARFWLEQLRKIDEKAIQNILDEVPESRMSPIAKKFTLELLKINQKRLLEKTV